MMFLINKIVIKNVFKLNMLQKYYEDIQIVILAGGKGTRLANINNGRPKSLTPILNVPIIEHQIRFCKSQGFKNFLLVLYYKSQDIIDISRKIQLKI